MQWYVAQPDGSTTGPCEASSALPNLPPPPSSAPPAPPKPPQASFKQVWGQAWGQALQEHNEKYGTATAGTSPTTVQVISVPRANHRSVSLASWILLFVSCLGATVPGLGFAVWLFIVPVLLVTFILGIIAISRGGVFQGILILGATLIAVPLFVLVAPIVTTGAAIAEVSRNTQSSSDPATSTQTSSSDTTSVSQQGEDDDPRLGFWSTDDKSYMLHFGKDGVARNSKSPKSMQYAFVSGDEVAVQTSDGEFRAKTSQPDKDRLVMVYPNGRSLEFSRITDSEFENEFAKADE
jgi:hypothetical protein